MFVQNIDAWEILLESIFCHSHKNLLVLKVVASGVNIAFEKLGKDFVEEHDFLIFKYDQAKVKTFEKLEGLLLVELGKVMLLNGLG